MGSCSTDSGGGRRDRIQTTRARGRGELVTSRRGVCQERHSSVITAAIWQMYIYIYYLVRLYMMCLKCIFMQYIHVHVQDRQMKRLKKRKVRERERETQKVPKGALLKKELFVSRESDLFYFILFHREMENRIGKQREKVICLYLILFVFWTPRPSRATERALAPGRSRAGVVYGSWHVMEPCR